MTSQVLQAHSVKPLLLSSATESQPSELASKHCTLRSDCEQAIFLEPFNSPDSSLVQASTSDASKYASTSGSIRRKAFPWDLRGAVIKSHKRKHVGLSSYFAGSGRLQNQSRAWRKAVMAAAFLSGFVLLLNIVFTIVLIVKYQVDGDIGVIYTGDCGLVKRWNTALHLVINLLSTCLLAASSFTMQCLSSPTRSEADAAHRQQIELDIGIVSFKNLFRMKWSKCVLWWGLALSTLPLHLLYNSTVFSTLGANEFAYIVVNENFFDRAPYHTFNIDTCSRANYCGLYNRTARDGPPTLDSVYEAWKSGHYGDRMTASQCIDAYDPGFIVGRRNMIAVTKATTGMRMAPGCAFNPLEMVSICGDESSGIKWQPLWNGSSVLGVDYAGRNKDQNWLCDGYDIAATGPREKCNGRYAQSLLSNNGTWYLRPRDHYTVASVIDRQSYPVEYCMSEGVSGDCQLQFVSYLLYIVVGCNFVKLICIISAMRLLWDLNEPILATIGDAVASFIEHPDETTKGWCNIDSTQIPTWRSGNLAGTLPSGCYNRPAERRLFAATSKTRWCTTISICILYWLFAIFLLQDSVGNVQKSGSISETWSMGLGAASPDALAFRSAALGLIPSILVANSFQLALSTTYFLYNSLYTAQCAAVEWSSYTSSDRKALRVSWPRGEQRSTYYLQLPYLYGVPLTLSLMLLHFLVSQSIFLVRVQWFKGDGSRSTESLAGLGFSPVAILVTVCVGGALILIQILHTLRPLNNGIPIHGNSSVVISAACHAMTNTSKQDNQVVEDQAEENMALQKIMWGAVIQSKGEDEVGHCSFSQHVVENPVNGRRYQ